VSVRELARHVLGCWGAGEVVEQAVASGPHEAHYLMLDAGKAVAELGWRPLLSVRERAAWTVEWYRAWRDDPASAWDSARAQVGRYQQACERRLTAAAARAA
jgi:CDP-glucose 4,6-dehydratase